MKILDIIGLQAQGADNVVKALHQLLADFQVYYTNLRGFHWNVKGKEFLQLHSYPEKMYDDTAEKVDEVAERILMLGGNPDNRFSEYLRVAQVKEVTNISGGGQIIENVLQTLSLLIASERQILSTASEVGDEVTVSLMSDYLKEQEKLVWMLSAYSAE